MPLPAPGSPIPVQQAGTYATEQAKLEAALPELLKAADAYPNTDAGITARYHAAGVLAGLGRRRRIAWIQRRAARRGARELALVRSPPASSLVRRRSLTSIRPSLCSLPISSASPRLPGS